MNPDHADVEVHQRLDAIEAAAHAVVATDGDAAIVGVAALGGLWLDETLTAGLARPAEVFSVYVARPWLGRGVGRAMLDDIERVAAAQGITDILAVSGPRHREIGYPFWNRRYGAFYRVDPDHWGEGHDRVVWRMSLA